MVPSAFVILDELPLTPNGKLDRRALPAPIDVLGLNASDEELPQGTTENALADIWMALLHLPAVRRHDHFFDIGGHSLHAVQLVARVQEQMGLNLALRQVFDAPTLMGMARALDAMNADANAIVPLAPITPAARDASLPLSWAQQRLWFLDQLDGASAAYVIPVALRLQGELDVPALRASLGAMVQRHQTLRTVFTSIEGQAAQRILDVAAFDMELLEANTGESAGHMAQEAQAAVMNSPFDLRTGPLIRARLVRVSGNEHLLFLAMHHIVSDGWSMGVLVQEVVTLYGLLTSPRQPGQASAQISHKAVQAALSTLPPLSIQYADYAVWQRRMLSGATLASQAAFWRETLHGAPSLITLPTDHARPAVQTYKGDRVPVALGSALTHDLKACAQRHGVTLHMLLLTSWSVLMARLSAQDDVVIGTPVSNRNRRELEGLIGFFVNTLPLRIRPQSTMDVAALLREVKHHTLAAYAHQDLPFDQIVEAVQPPRSLSHSPVFQVLFSLNNTPASEATLPGLKASTLALPATSTQFDLALGLQEAEADIVGSLDFASDLFEQATMLRWIALWRTLLQGFCEAQPDTLLSALPWLDAAERQLVVDEFNATTKPYPEHSVIHELFEAQARRHPDAIALEFKGTRLSYAELDIRSNQLARELRQHGIGPDRVAGILLGRGVQMMVAVLGVLKAGGAYVPLDPNYPMARLQHMVADSQPTLIITSQDCAALAQKLPDARYINIDHEWPSIRLQDGTPLSRMETGLQPDDLAYIIYTSGSTGLPKGVMIEHQGLCNLATWQGRALGLGTNSRVLQFFSFSFDACVWEWMMALCHGATLVLAEREALMPGTPLLDTLTLARITHATLPPAA
jgi:non-ribosomal peptide synthetase component F